MRRIASHRLGGFIQLNKYIYTKMCVYIYIYMYMLFAHYVFMVTVIQEGIYLEILYRKTPLGWNSSFRYQEAVMQITVFMTALFSLFLATHVWQEQATLHRAQLLLTDLFVGSILFITNEFWIIFRIEKNCWALKQKHRHRVSADLLIAHIIHLANFPFFHV